jgi:hypothetical protein
MPGFYLLVILILIGVSPQPLAAQDAVGYAASQPYQRAGQSTTTTRKEQVEPNGTKTSKETVSTQSQGSTYRYSGLPGKFIRSGGQTLRQGSLLHESGLRRYYRYEFAYRGVPKGSNPSEAYWFETSDGQLMMVDPLVTQRYSNNPR